MWHWEFFGLQEVIVIDVPEMLAHRPGGFVHCAWRVPHVHRFSSWSYWTIELVGKDWTAYIPGNIAMSPVHSLALLVESRPAAPSFLQFVYQPLHLGSEIRVVLQHLNQDLLQSTLLPFGVRPLLGQGQGLLGIGAAPELVCHRLTQLAHLCAQLLACALREGLRSFSQEGVATEASVNGSICTTSLMECWVGLK